MPGVPGATLKLPAVLEVIDGGCPLMFAPTADTGHKVMRLMGVGHMPKQV